MRRKSAGLMNFKIIIIVSAVIFTVIQLFSEKAVRPLISLQAEHSAKSCAERIVNETVKCYLEENKYMCSDFAVVLYDENEKAVSVETLPYNINKVQSELSVCINESLEENNEVSVKIPVGSFMDSYFLEGKGFNVKLKVHFSGVSAVSLKSSFTSAGENQSCHRIYADIHTDIISVSPLYSFSTCTDFEFLLAESIIVGDVSPIMQ